jgi:predicted CopG family antitoxin
MGYKSMPTKHESMSDTSIRVSDELADELFDRKKRGESYEDVIWRLIEQADESDHE